MRQRGGGSIGLEEGGCSKRWEVRSGRGDEDSYLSECGRRLRLDEAAKIGKQRTE